VSGFGMVKTTSSVSEFFGFWAKVASSPRYFSYTLLHSLHGSVGADSQHQLSTINRYGHRALTKSFLFNFVSKISQKLSITSMVLLVPTLVKNFMQ